MVEQRPAAGLDPRALIAVAVAIATAGAIFAGALLLTHHRGYEAPLVAPTSPVPTSPTSSASPPDASAIIRDGHPTSFAANGAGDLMTVWRTCADEQADTGCRYAWQLRNKRGVFTGLALGQQPSAYAAGASFVISSWSWSGIVVDASGVPRPLSKATSPGTIAAGQIVSSTKQHTVVVDPASATYWRLPAAPGTGTTVGGAISRDDTVWALTGIRAQTRIVWNDGSGWHDHLLPAANSANALPGYVVVSGDRVAAVSGYDGATILPIADLAVTTDGGRTWRDLHQADLPFSTVDAIAATAGGTLYVATAGGEKLFRSADSSWTHFEQLPNPHRIDGLSPAGDTVLAVGGSYLHPKLLTYDDAGRATAIAIER